MNSHRDRTLFVFSDIEMGDGGPRDGFRQTEPLGELIHSLSSSAQTNRVEIVFNGDTFDFMKTTIEGRYPHHITKERAMQKAVKISNAHQLFFSHLRDFLAQKNRAVHFVVGNHDFELLFPSIQDFIREQCGGSHVYFPGWALSLGDVHIEHGSQLDRLFWMDPEDSFVDYKGQNILRLPWATVAIMDSLLPIPLDELYFLDRIRPKKELLNALPEVKALIQAANWKYWTSDFPADYLRNIDPLKCLRMPMLKEIFKQLFWLDLDLNLDFQHHRLLSSNQSKLYVLGHLHAFDLKTLGDAKLIQMGCFRNEYKLMEDGNHFENVKKAYVEIQMQGSVLIDSRHVELESFPLTHEKWPMELTSFQVGLKRSLESLKTPSNAWAWN